jgi:hypothetical protein
MFILLIDVDDDTRSVVFNDLSLHDTHYFGGASFDRMFKIDNITRGTWKPHFFDEASFVEVFKLDNITRGTWKPHFFDRA